MTTPTHSQEKTFRVTIATPDVPAFREAMSRVSFGTMDTGERVTTDDGADAETVLAVSVPRELCLTRAERVAALLVP